MAKKRKKKKRQLFKIFTNKFFAWVFLAFLAVGVFLLAGYQIYRAGFFRVDQESLRSNVDIDKSFINKIKGKSIFDLNLDKLYAYLMRKYPEYKEIKILKKFPNFVEIEMKKRKPIAQIRAKNFYLIDKDGVIISQGEDNRFEKFPVIVGSSFDQHLTKGRDISSQNLRTAFKLIRIVEKESLLKVINSLDADYQFKLGDINVSSPETIYFYLSNQKYYQRRIKVILNRRDLKEKMVLLKKLIKQELGEKLSLIRYIDFRFQKVAVGFKR
ncbi:MAG: cell division protein FtsQ/DivIB [Candidatus Omnitrophota bacterium]